MYTDLEGILSACLYLCVSFYSGVVNFCRYVSVCLSVCLPACLSTYVSVCLPTCLFVCNRSYSWNHRYSCNCGHSCNRRYSCNCDRSCNCRYSSAIIEKPQLSCATLLEKVALNYLFKTTHSPSTGEIQIYRKKLPQRILRWPLPSKAGTYSTHLAGFYEGDMLPWVLSSILIQRIYPSISSIAHLCLVR